MGKCSSGVPPIEVEVLSNRRFTGDGDDILWNFRSRLSEAVPESQVRVQTSTGDLLLLDAIALRWQYTFEK